MFKVSQSKVNAWRTCRQKYHYKYVEELEPKKKSRPLKFGSIIHEMVEAEANKKNPMKVLSSIARREEKLFDAERELYGNIVEDITYIMNAYFDYWEKDPLIYLSHKKKYAEHEFEIELVKGEILAKGKIDAVARYRKLNSLVEHKSHKNIPNEEHRWRNLQSVFYIRIADMLGWFKLEGTVWDYIRSKPPTRPELLKSGGFSSRAIDTLPQVIIDVAKANKLKPPAELLKTVTSNQSSWFQRVYTPANKNVIDSVFADFVATSQEMMALHGKSSTRTFGRHCEWCDFRHICAAKLKGHDEGFIKEREFIKNGSQVEDTEIE